MVSRFQKPQRPEGSGPTCTNGQKGTTINQNPSPAKLSFQSRRDQDISRRTKAEGLAGNVPGARRPNGDLGRLSLEATRRNTASVKVKCSGDRQASVLVPVL